MLNTLEELREYRTSLWAHVRHARILVILSVPMIYVCLLPFLLLDLFVSVYQSVCFPVYGVPKVRRADYLIFDRGRLAYLNAIGKVGCVYCSYANGLLAYVAEIAGRTEQRFCPIKHDEAPLRTHSRYGRFVPYGNARTYRTKAEEINHYWSDLRPPPK